MKNTFQISFICLLLIFVSCKKDSESILGCDNSETEFSSLMDLLVAQGHTDHFSYEAEVHQCTLTVASQKILCQIGYQSTPATKDEEYEFIIYDVTDRPDEIIYRGRHSFSDTRISYVDVPEGVVLKPNRWYYLHRILAIAGPNKGKATGRVVEVKQDGDWSNISGVGKHTLKYGDLEIWGTNFHSLSPGGPDAKANPAVPYIDLVFESN